MNNPISISCVKIPPSPTELLDSSAKYFFFLKTSPIPCSHNCDKYNKIYRNMKIKSYNLFLESKRYQISKEEENNIKQYFYDRLDGEVIDGKEINEYDSTEFSVTNWNRQQSNTFKFSEDWHEFDSNGQNKYSSKILKEKKPFFWDSDKERDWEIKFRETNFSIYHTIIVNIIFESESIISYLNQIFDNLIEDDYLVQAWHPKPNEWRFHIATKTSNPFQTTENKLSKLYGTY